MPKFIPKVASDPYVIDCKREPQRARETEWILPSGNGSFAMGTAGALARRKYHNLLNGATRPPVGRFAALHSVRVRAVMEGGSSAIELNERECDRFEKTPTACVWTYLVDGMELTISLRMGWRASTCFVRIALTGARTTGTLVCAPRVTLRDFHEVLPEDAHDHEVSVGQDSITVRREGVTLAMRASNGSVQSAQEWEEQPEYDLETQRGYPAQERTLIPGTISLPIENGGAEVTIAASVLEDLPDPSGFDDRSRDEHLAKIESRAVEIEPAIRGLLPLVRAADDYIIERDVHGQRLASVLAGFPWFADWGRDTMISLPGLMLECGRYEDARDCLVTFAKYTSDGMIPNRFDDDTNEPHYNTVDASLWFINAVRQYKEKTGDSGTVNEVLLPACAEIVRGYSEGTRFGIGVDPEDGLVTAGDETTQLTWMDAKRDGVVFTPRHGKAVEINALWHNALHCVADLLGTHTPEADKLRSEAARVSDRFVSAFYDPARGYLIDCLRPDGKGKWEAIDEVRPNQLFAVSLPHSPLPKNLWQIVVAKAGEALLTPFGMKTLGAGDPKYRARFEGDMMERDAAYHNGTVWPWLIGPYCEAHLRAQDFSNAAREHAAAAITPLIESTLTGCIGQLAEVYDADEPQRAQGCMAQAWSVAEVLRVGLMIERK